MESKVVSFFLDLQQRQCLGCVVPCLDEAFWAHLRSWRPEADAVADLFQRWGYTLQPQAQEPEHDTWIRRRLQHLQHRLASHDVAATSTAASAAVAGDDADGGGKQDEPALDQLQDTVGQMYRELPANVSTTIKETMDDVKGILGGSQLSELTIANTIETLEKTFRQRLANHAISEEELQQTAQVVQSYLTKLKHRLPAPLSQLIELFEELIHEFLRQHAKGDAAPASAAASAPAAAATKGGRPAIDPKDMSSMLSEFLQFSKELKSGQTRTAHAFAQKMMSKLLRLLGRSRSGSKLTQQERLRALLEKRRQAKAQAEPGL